MTGLTTAAAVAAMLGISPRTVYDLAASGRLPSYRIGGSIRFDPDEVQRFKESCKVTVAQPVGVSTSLLQEAFAKAGVKPKLTPPTSRQESVRP